MSKNAHIENPIRQNYIHNNKLVRQAFYSTGRETFFENAKFLLWGHVLKPPIQVTVRFRSQSNIKIHETTGTNRLS